MDKPTASAEELMRQGSQTAHYYFVKAIDDIDEQLGEGFAKQHPELIGAHMNAAALDFHAACLAASLWEIAQSVDGVAAELINTSSDEIPQE